MFYVKLCNSLFSFKFRILSYQITFKGPRGTTDKIATIPVHLVLFSAALVEQAKSIPVQTLILFSHFSSACLFFILSLGPVGLSLLNQKTFRRGQITLVTAS